MKSTIRSFGIMLAMTCLALPGSGQEAAPAGELRLHAIFDSDMAFPPGKPKE